MNLEPHIDRHLHGIGLPSPGGWAELSEICGHIASLPATAVGDGFVEGVDGIGDRPRAMAKVHHAGVDGVPAPT
ncbi:acyltransferase [Mycobacterium tuberculosis]|uniref:acyltransferase n=1 Tax=Mycobacterium tuberculosis TaxID=1773 RepID=UPI00207B535A|nr:acyltransferase [Mycobacterium tuberculosis]MCN4145633.1 acyltransferase [Mycobacterium tuberculosis]MCN4309814.1 acyltransferase [Mycobacterium tuberculosis]